MWRPCWDAEQRENTAREATAIRHKEGLLGFPSNGDAYEQLSLARVSSAPRELSNGTFSSRHSLSFRMPLESDPGHTTSLPRASPKRLTA